MSRLAGVVLALTVVVGSVSAEDELYLSATNKFEYRRLDQASTREEALRNRFEVSGYYGVFEVWLRLESLQLSDAGVYDPYGVADDAVTGEQRFDQMELSQRLIAMNVDDFRAEVGDVSHVFGQGLMLSVFEDETLNFDTRLEGFRARLDHERGRATVVAGSNEGNRFRGLFLEPEFSGPVRVGASFVEAWGAELNTNIAPREQHAGAYAEFEQVLGPLDATLYGEYVERQFPGKDGVGRRGTPGRGAFVSGQVTWESVTVLSEYRDFFRFEHDYHDPPTTLRQHTWTLLNRANGQTLSDIPDDDVQGTLVQVDYSYDFFTSLQGSWAKLEQEDGSDFFEVYGEAKTHLGKNVSITAAGAESEFNLGILFEERITGMGELVLELDERNSLTLGVEWSEVQESDEVTQAFEFPVEYSERIWWASWGLSPWLNLTVTYEDTTEDDPTEERDEWYTVFAEIAVADNQDLEISFGSERAGWKCTGGVCFFEPEFEGFKVKWVSRF